MTFLLVYTFIYLAFAVGAVLLSNKFGLGSVLGYLIAGIFIGPILGFAGKETESIQHIAEFGVVMMLFLVGLELEPKKLWQLRHKLLGLGGLQVVLSVSGLAAVGVFVLGVSWQMAVAMGCILALSSTAIVLQTFSEKHLLQTSGGQAGFAVLLFQDVAAIPMLALMPLLATAAVVSGRHESNGNLLADQAGWVVALVSVGAILLIIVSVIFIVPKIFRFISKNRLHEMFTVFTLALVVGIATLMSVIGLSPALGAFIAGVALANSAYRHEMESHLEPFKGIFLGLFFITVGAGMNFTVLGNEWGLILGLTLGVMLIKALILFVLGKLFRVPSMGSKLLALSLAQAGEFGFVLLSIANQNRVLPPIWSDRMSLVVAISMVLTPLLFVFYDKVLSKKAILAENEQRETDQIPEENSVVLLGNGRFGQQINNMLLACGFHTTVIDNHVEMVEGLTKYGVKTYYGDATNPEMLKSIGLGKAKLLIVAIDHAHSTEVVEFVRRQYPDLRIIVRAYDSFHSHQLHHAGANIIIRETMDSALRSGRVALEFLGVSPEKARELTKFYAARERHLLDQMSPLFDPEKSVFDNEALLSRAKEVDLETHEMIQAILRGETIEWQENESSWTHLKKSQAYY